MSILSAIKGVPFIQDITKFIFVEFAIVFLDLFNQANEISKGRVLQPFKPLLPFILYARQRLEMFYDGSGKIVGIAVKPIDHERLFLRKFERAIALEGCV